MCICSCSPFRNDGAGKRFRRRGRKFRMLCSVLQFALCAGLLFFARLCHALWLCCGCCLWVPLNSAVVAAAADSAAATPMDRRERYELKRLFVMQRNCFALSMCVCVKTKQTLNAFLHFGILRRTSFGRYALYCWQNLWSLSRIPLLFAATPSHLFLPACLPALNLILFLFCSLLISSTSAYSASSSFGSSCCTLLPSVSLHTLFSHEINNLTNCFALVMAAQFLFLFYTSNTAQIMPPIPPTHSSSR